MKNTFCHAFVMTQFFAANTARRTGALDRYERSIEPPSGEPTRVAVLSVKRDRSKGIRVNQRLQFLSAVSQLVLTSVMRYQSVTGQ